MIKPTELQALQSKSAKQTNEIARLTQVADLKWMRGEST